MKKFSQKLKATLLLIDRFLFLFSVICIIAALLFHNMLDGYHLERHHHVSLLLMACLPIIIVFNSPYYRLLSFFKSLSAYIITYKKIKNWIVKFIVGLFSLIPYLVADYAYGLNILELMRLIVFVLTVLAGFYVLTAIISALVNYIRQLDISSIIKKVVRQVLQLVIHINDNFHQKISTSVSKKIIKQDDRKNNGDNLTVEPIQEFWPKLELIRKNEFTHEEIEKLKKSNTDVPKSAIQKVLNATKGQLLALDNNTKKRKELTGFKIEQTLAMDSKYDHYRSQWLFN